MLSVEIIRNGDAVQVMCDQAGLDQLRSAVDLLGKNGHVHLSTCSAATFVLSEQTPWGRKAVTEVIFTVGGD